MAWNRKKSVSFLSISFFFASCFSDRKNPKKNGRKLPVVHRKKEEEKQSICTYFGGKYSIDIVTLTIASKSVIFQFFLFPVFVQHFFFFRNLGVQPCDIFLEPHTHFKHHVHVGRCDLKVLFEAKHISRQYNAWLTCDSSSKFKTQ